MRKKVMKSIVGIQVDDKDICIECEHLYECPLIHALNSKMVSLNSDNGYSVKECDLFEGNRLYP